MLGTCSTNCIKILLSCSANVTKLAQNAASGGVGTLCARVPKHATSEQRLPHWPQSQPKCPSCQQEKKPPQLGIVPTKVSQLSAEKTNSTTGHSPNQCPSCQHKLFPIGHSPEQCPPGPNISPLGTALSGVPLAPTFPHWAQPRAVSPGPNISPLGTAQSGVPLAPTFPQWAQP